MQAMAPSQLRTKQFKALERKWRKKLLQSGFVDCEYQNGALKQHDRRTALFDDQEAVRQFFAALDEYLAGEPELPKAHRKILELYTGGMRQVDIAKKVRRSRTTVQTTIYNYIKRIPKT
jgi:DNA-binding NarL/FixJ family response regulator